LDKELVAHLESFLTASRREKNKTILENRTQFLTIAIEDVYQLHNTSAVMRSCEVFGVQDIHIIEEKNQKKIDREIAMGAQKWVDIHRYHSSKNCIETLKYQGYQIVATTPSTENHYTLSEFPIDRPTAIFLGSEKDGLSDEVLKNADAFLTIPMRGFTQSLNVSVCGALILNDLTTKLHSSSQKLPWQLSEEKKLQKRYEWACQILKSHKEIENRYWEMKK